VFFRSIFFFTYNSITGAVTDLSCLQQLTTSISYAFAARMAETATHFTSPASLIDTFTTDTIPIPDKVLQNIIQPLSITGLSFGTSNIVAGLNLPALITHTR
jgi:hypothetical protein